MLESYDLMVGKHGEVFVWEMMENWELFMGFQQMQPMTLEERWMRFLQETETEKTRLAA